ncbi:MULTISPECIES: Uma2 family endonuclease [Spirulina sp. CCY15215]|uniref:Uma2 family endonuclease n=1 Tax=Spirulina sp. CCY15215 TaxID=2767591 RepID=UPI001EF3468B|nr:Uma2 family endonuclease [Spirulina major]
MRKVESSAAMTGIILNLQPFVEFSNDQFYELCRIHQELNFERTARGELVILPLSGGLQGIRIASLIGELGLWNRRSRLGKVFSSTGFILPNGAIRSPCIAWIPSERWENLTLEQREKFLPFCPDFAIELRSKSDSLPPLQRKMEKYIENGLRLGWLIDPKNRQVEIYRQNRDKEVLENCDRLEREDILPGFMLDLSIIWEE